jgi:hypothetical protein
LKHDPEEEILSSFTETEQQEIKNRQQVLSSLAYFVGKDFDIPVLLNEPGGGWYWDQEKNHMKVDPKDLLEKPMDYLRFVTCHEAGHRRISRILNVIPTEVWQQPGFPFMFNALEDPRDNNFVAEAYPRFKEQMVLSYDLIDEEHKAQVKAKGDLGHQPKSMQAGFEYMKQWLREVKGEEFAIDPALPPDVQEVVQKTLLAAQDSWWRYPSKTEADTSEDIITKYAATAYEIDYEHIWPEFKKLVDEDIQKQTQQEALQKAMQGGQPSPLSQELAEKLSPEEKQELEKALQPVLEGEGTKEPVVDLDSLSEGLKQKIQEYVDDLPPEIKEELRKQAVEAIKEFAEEISQQLQGKLIPTTKAAAGKPDQQPTPEVSHPPEKPDISKLKKTFEDIVAKDANVYEKYRTEVLGIIGSLENDLRETFTQRRAHQWKTGFRSGKKIDFKRRIQEEAKDILPIESRAWEKREAPQEKDYAVTLLVDLSGSMSRDGKIEETFKGVVALAEVLNRLSIKTEIIGFNDRLYQYQNFGENLSSDIREKMGGMLKEVNDAGPRRDEKAQYNDDGWAVHQVSQRLQKQKASEKLLIVLSDGLPAPSAAHSDEEFDLKKVVEGITKETRQKVIGLGIGRDTEHVRQYYPNNIANVEVHEMAETLAELIKEMIANP